MASSRQIGSVKCLRPKATLFDCECTVRTVRFENYPREPIRRVTRRASFVWITSLRRYTSCAASRTVFDFPPRGTCDRPAEIRKKKTLASKALEVGGETWEGGVVIEKKNRPDRQVSGGKKTKTKDVISRERSVRVQKSNFNGQSRY